jgi:signal transduction histidine kinase
VLYFAAHENITHIKHNEAALRETEKKYNLLDENVTDMISVHEKDGRYSFVSHSHRAIIETPHVSTASYRIRQKDGPYLWVETTSKVVSDSTTGEIAQVIAVTRDITERKKAEELLNEHQNSLEKTVRERTAELQKANSTLKEELERLFADFSQGDDSTTRKYGGIGLGLTMVRRLITLLGGTWDLESREGEGSLFAFSLPLQEFE